MRGWRRVIVASVVVAVLLVLTVPDALLWAASTIRAVATNQIDGVERAVPRSVVITIAMAVLFVISFLIIFGTVRLFTSVGVSKGSRIAYWYDQVTPNSPTTKAVAFIAVFSVVFLVGIAVFVPYLGASLTTGSGIDDVVRDIKQGNYAGEVPDLFEDDAIRRGDGDVPQKEFGRDTDGDRLPDRWELDNETAGGGSIPDANPDRMDLYVQVNYGSNVDRLTASERRQLRDVWSDMPVENPDGSSGIEIHLVDNGERAGDIGEEVSITGKAAVDRYYTEDRLGDRYCTYHQVTLGEIVDGTSIGYAETPGHSSVLAGSRFENYDGDVSFRVAMITHALLHNVVGGTNEGVHTDGGWLDYPSAENEYLSDSVARQLEDDGFVTASGDTRRCSNDA